MTWENPWDAYVEDPDYDDQRYLRRILRDNQMVITVESSGKDEDMTWLEKEHTREFQGGWWDADIDRDPGFPLPFNPGAYADGLVPPSEEYCDGYTARWFESIPGETITCGNRKDWFKAQRHHDWVCLGFDSKNKGAEGIVQVIVFACTVCGRDFR